MEKGTFGCPIKYKMLPAILERIDVVNEKKTLCSFIERLNLRCKNIKKIKDNPEYDYFLDLMRNEYKRNLIEMEQKYDKVLVSYIKNYVLAKMTDCYRFKYVTK